MRSLLLFWLFNARNESAELVIGVRKDDSIFNSHAWIELKGKVVGENENAPLGFTTMLRFSAFGSQQSQ